MRPYLVFASIVIGFFFSQMSFASCVGLGCSCSVGATAVSFGAYAPLSGSANNSTGTVSVTCGAIVLGGLISYTIDLSTGNNGSYSPRKMSSGANTLNYNLYSDSGRTQIWGNTTGGTVNVSDNYLLALSPTTRNYTVYGNIPASQNVAVGSYSDQITVTITF